MAKTTKRKSFIFNIEWQEVLLEYPAEVRLEVYDAIIEYVASGTLSELKPMARIAFSFIKKEIDYNEQRYQDVVNKRSEAGKRSAESRNNNKSTNLTNVNKCQQASTNATDNVNDNDIVNDLKEKELSNESPKKKGFDLSFVSPEYHKAFTEWLQYKKDRKETYKTQQSLQKCYTKLINLSGNNPSVAQEIVDQSIASNYAGLFELKKSNKPTATQQAPAGVQLGYGERIVDGRRTYGTGKSTIPMNAPPRPGDGYSWSAEANKWVY